MERREWLAREFEEQRPHLRAVAYRMLGSLTEADDAVQDSWLRLERTDGTIDDFRAWLTTVVGRICLDMLRARRARPDETGRWVPEPIVSDDPADDPEEQALAADSISLALLVVLERLSPAERVAFVLHDVFGVPFDDIAPIVERSPAAARQLASRARRRVQAEAPNPDADLAVQRQVVDAFLAASRGGRGSGGTDQDETHGDRCDTHGTNHFRPRRRAQPPKGGHGRRGVRRRARSSCRCRAGGSRAG